jgi:zinc protease
VGAALELLQDITEHPAFQPAEVERIRKERLASILQEADSPVQSILRVGPRVLYGDSPYAYPETGTTAAVQEISRGDIAGFWSAHYGPRNAALVISGDVTEQDSHRLAERYFGDWSSNASAAAPPIPTTPGVVTRRVVIVDKPGAPQTVLGMFSIGLPRSTPDYPAVEIMNGILGGLFSIRINMNLRERNGFNYGAFSIYFYHRGAGPFLAGSLVRTDVTAPATREMVAELNRIRTDPPTPEELRMSRENALRSLPGRFETGDEISREIGALFTYGLPVDYYRILPGKFEATGSEAVTRAAIDYVHPEQMVVVAVGDRAKIQAGLEQLKLGPIEYRNESGNLVTK